MARTLKKLVAVWTLFKVACWREARRQWKAKQYGIGQPLMKRFDRLAAER